MPHAKAQGSTPPAIDFWFDFGSNYSYLSTMRIYEMASRREVQVVWRPFFLGAIFHAQGRNTSPFVLQKAKGDYVWQDMKRECRKVGLPWRQPSKFPRSSLLPLRVAIASADKEWIGAYCCKIMSLNFVEDRDIDDRDTVKAVLQELGLGADEILDLAVSDANKLALRRQTEQAQAKGIFGAPTFIVGEEMFWGNDRLDDAVSAFKSLSR